MECSQGITEAITTLIKLMVDRPDDVVVELVVTEAASSLRVSVAHADVGKLIGKQGRTARSLRVLVAAMGMAANQKIGLDIESKQRLLEHEEGRFPKLFQ